MKEYIQQLIAEGRTADALDYLVMHNRDAILLQARYNQAKKQQNMGLIDFGEWSRVQNQVNYAALEMAGNIKVLGSNNVVISNVSDSQIIINTRVQNNVKVTINFSSVDTFKESINRLDLPTLISLATSEFKGKEAMKAWLPIKQEYDSYELLGTPFAPGYLTQIKEKLILIYDEYWTKAAEEKNKEIKEAVMAIYNSLGGEITEDLIRDAADEFKLFFYQNDESGFRGHGIVDAILHDLESEKIKFLKRKSPAMFQKELEKMHNELIIVSNRILTKLEA